MIYANSRLASLSGGSPTHKFKPLPRNKFVMNTGKNNIFSDKTPPKAKSSAEMIPSVASAETQKQIKAQPFSWVAGKRPGQPSFDDVTYRYGQPEGRNNETMPMLGFDSKTVGDLAGGQHNPNMKAVMLPTGAKIPQKVAAVISDILVEDDGHNYKNDPAQAHNTQDNPVGTQTKDLKYSPNYELKKQRLRKKLYS